jgi:hypothetical protein
MSGQFEPLAGGGAAVALDEVEISILRSLAVQMLELIGPGDEQDAQPEGGDPLDEVFRDFRAGPSEPPADPALARLFPDAYGGPDAKLGGDEEKAARSASAEFRRFTENDLRARKREDALTVVRTLDALAASRAAAEDSSRDTGGRAGRNRRGGRGRGGAGAAVLELRPEEAPRWLGTLNDLRLTIGTRLGVTDEEDGGELLRLPDSDPRKPMVMAYFWLGGLQETLVEALMP